MLLLYILTEQEELVGTEFERLQGSVDAYALLCLCEILPETLQEQGLAVDLPLIGVPHVCGSKSFFPFTEFVKACVDECGAFAEFLINGHRHCTLADEPLFTAVPKSERSLALGGEPRMGSAYGDAPDDRHKSFFVGSFRLNEERYLQFVFFHFSVVFSKLPLLAKVQMNKSS